MPSYTRRTICPQLCCLVLTVALLVLPLAGVRVESAPILSPLVTELVPLGASLRSPPASQFPPPSFAALGRLLLGPLPRASLVPSAGSNGRIHNITSPGFADSRASDHPHGRAPPSD